MNAYYTVGPRAIGKNYGNGGIEIKKTLEVVKMNRIFALKIGALLVLSLSFFIGCSSDKDQGANTSLNESIMQKHKKDIQKKEQDGLLLSTSPLTEAEKELKKKQRDSAEGCQKAFEKCVNNCKNESCEDVCMRQLSGCERDLPVEVRTLK